MHVNPAETIKPKTKKQHQGGRKSEKKVKKTESQLSTKMKLKTDKKSVEKIDIFVVDVRKFKRLYLIGPV